MTIVRVSTVCLIDRWIWISVSSVLHFVCCTFFSPSLLLYLLLVVLIIYPIYYRTCKPCAMNHYPISLVQITLIPIWYPYTFLGLHMITKSICYLERLSCLRIPHFEALTLISWTKEEESLSWQEICHSGWFLVRNINFVVSVLKLLVSNGNFFDDWASSCKTKPIIALKLLVHCFIQQCAIWYKANVISSWFFPNSENDSLMTAKLRCVWVPKSFKV